MSEYTPHVYSSTTYVVLAKVTLLVLVRGAQVLHGFRLAHGHERALPRAFKCSC